MPWDAITRIEHNRDHLRYPSDLTDGEWAIIAPFIPPAKSGGRRRTTNMRDVLDALMYLATGGCQWRMLPKDFPPCSTVQRYFYAWREDGFWQSINHILVMETRELNGREASPSAGVIDSQSVKTTESAKGYEGVCGYDAGKKIKGRKRHIVTDTTGNMVGLVVHSADIQDRDGAIDVLKSIRHSYPWLRHIFADGGYAGDKLRGNLTKIGQWTVEIVKRSDAAKGFEVIPRRWVVERTFAWMGRCRRLAKDYETSISSSTVWTLIAHIRKMTRNLARYQFQT